MVAPLDLVVRDRAACLVGETELVRRPEIAVIDIKQQIGGDLESDTGDALIGEIPDVAVQAAGSGVGPKSARTSGLSARLSIILTAPTPSPACGLIGGSAMPNR